MRIRVVSGGGSAAASAGRVWTRPAAQSVFIRSRRFKRARFISWQNYPASASPNSLAQARLRVRLFARTGYAVMQPASGVAEDVCNARFIDGLALMRPRTAPRSPTRQVDHDLLELALGTPRAV